MPVFERMRSIAIHTKTRTPFIAFFLRVAPGRANGVATITASRS